jgi:threonine dehydratase
MFNIDELRASASAVYHVMPATPQYTWPLLSKRLNCEVWVKHENHTPTGAFKIRGGIIFINCLLKREPNINGIITATRGNHGQSLALAATKADCLATWLYQRVIPVKKCRHAGAGRTNHRIRC